MAMLAIFSFFAQRFSGMEWVTACPASFVGASRAMPSMPSTAPRCNRVDADAIRWPAPAFHIHASLGRAYVHLIGHGLKCLRRGDVDDSGPGFFR